jgi:hypothetical protein
MSAELVWEKRLTFKRQRSQRKDRRIFHGSKKFENEALRDGAVELNGDR